MVTSLVPLGAEFTLLSGNESPDDAITLSSGSVVLSFESNDFSAGTVNYGYEIFSPTGQPLMPLVSVDTTSYLSPSRGGLRLTATSDGSFTTQYNHEDSASRTFEYVLQHYDAPGQAAGAPVTLSQTRPSGITPVAILDDGSLVQPFSYLTGVHFPADEVSQFQLYSPAGVSLGPPSPPVAGYDEHIFALQSGGFRHSGHR